MKKKKKKKKFILLLKKTFILELYGFASSLTFKILLVKFTNKKTFILELYGFASSLTFKILLVKFTKEFHCKVSQKQDGRSDGFEKIF
ncbi:hypothetical protein T4D_16900 [Trichinella pseudospiralis]|uniref:Uncharacterized protein n=1 Tax=Trichinella pseudospiralis TaxID=6337 RepID=A0A0V1FNR9_TRIPS|nr:hypothetical protein T4D_16900 [Trichinella pseudospiralis]